MKYLIFIGLFLAGGISGYFIGANKKDKELISNEPEKELVTTFIYDTIVETETIEVPVYKEITKYLDSVTDTIALEIELDTLKENILQKDAAINEEVVIKRDELKSTMVIAIEYLEAKTEKDSVIKELLGIKENRPLEMTVQFWESPVGFTGYKLSKNTLVIYGLSPQFDYSIYHKNELHYLSNKEIYYVLNETQVFLPFIEVQKGIVLDD